MNEKRNEKRRKERSLPCKIPRETGQIRAVTVRHDNFIAAIAMARIPALAGGGLAYKENNKKTKKTRKKIKRWTEI